MSTLLESYVYLHSFRINGELVGSASASKYYSEPDRCPYRDSMFDDKDPGIKSGLLNNTILQIGGYSNGKSMVGMLQDFVVFKNVALERKEINHLIEYRAPKRLPTLEMLMQHYKIPSSNGKCKQNYMIYIPCKAY